MKERYNVSLDEEIHDKAQEMGLNISAVCEDALLKKIGEKKSEVLKCEFCGKNGFKETADTVKANLPNALTFLNPDEKWICNSCLRRKAKNSTIGQ